MIKSLSVTQLRAIELMARRQIARWPETRFRLTNRDTHSDHPACGGTNHLFINRTTAASLYDAGLAEIRGFEDKERVWLKTWVLRLVEIGDGLR